LAASLGDRSGRLTAAPFEEGFDVFSGFLQAKGVKFE
jgi:hypothetical protein